MTRFGARGWRGTVKQRARALRTILERLFPISKQVELQPVAQHSEGILRLLVSHSGTRAHGVRRDTLGVSGVSVVLLGEHKTLQERFQQYAKFREGFKQSGELFNDEQLFGPCEPVAGDQYISGAAALIKGGLWEHPALYASQRHW